jgi:NADPH:quinone reductase-like Zn-dependent oxidoreductase
MDLPQVMKAIEAPGFGLDRLRLVERPVPVPGPDDILIRLTAATLNYRDLAMVKGTYKPEWEGPFIPASDGCGEVVAIGPRVRRFRIGDRVVPTYVQGWISGKPTPDQRANRTLGVPLDGVLREYIAVPAEDAVPAPPSLTDMEAATLPIAALTAWTTLQEGGVKPGDWVLVQGTGGAAVFALQFAKLAGARVVIITSTDEKLARALALGADAGINFRKTVDWVTAVKEATEGWGADIVIETQGTPGWSIAAAAFGGFVGMVGFTGWSGLEFDVHPLVTQMIRLHGIATGSRSSFEAMNRAIETHRLKPVLDQIFPLERSRDALELMQADGHFGKIGIEIGAPT